MTLNPFSAVAAKIYAGLFGSALALTAIQTVRINGLWFVVGLEGRLEVARTNLRDEKLGRADDRADWARQVAGAAAAKAAAERTSKEISIDAQASQAALLADNAGLRDYIAAHRLPGTAGAGTAASAGAPGDHAPGISSPASAGAFVAATEADLVTCDADYAYAAGAFEFGQKLISAGLVK